MGEWGGEVNLLLGDNDEEDTQEDDDSSDSNDSDASTSTDGKTVTIEAKMSKSANLSQMVATCVVTSFTEKNLNPSKSAMVPTILIDEHKCRVCLYDCDKDILLIFSIKSLSTKGHLSQSAMVFLWAALNHR